MSHASPRVVIAGAGPAGMTVNLEQRFTAHVCVAGRGSPCRRRFEVDEVPAAPANNAVLGELAFVVNRRVRLRDGVSLFAVGGQVIESFRHLAIFDFAIRRFEEAEIVDARKGCQ